MKLKTKTIAAALFLGALFAVQNVSANSCSTERVRVVRGDSLGSILSRMRKEFLMKSPLWTKKGLVAQTLALNPRIRKNANLLKVGANVRLPKILVTQMAARFKETSNNTCSFVETTKPQRTYVLKAPKPEDLFYSPVLQKAPQAERKVASIVESKAEIKDSNVPSFDDLGKSRATLGGGLQTNQMVPQGFINGQIPIGKRFEITPLISAIQSNYLPNNYSMLETTVRASAAYRFHKQWRVGVGFRYFNFGYTTSANFSATSLEAVAHIAHKASLGSRTEWDNQVWVANSFSLVGTDGVASSAFQLSSVGLLSQLRYLAFKNIYVGPYALLENFSLNWTQPDGNTNAFIPFQVATGVSVGIGF